jgi:hypothetical protein
MVAIGLCRPRLPRAAHSMTIVRMKVAKSEPTFSTPIFAKIAVSAAKTADRMAHTCQDWEKFIQASYNKQYGERSVNSDNRVQKSNRLFSNRAY